MIERFCPDLYVDKLTTITPCHLKNHELSGLILDLDNTLVAWDSDSPPEEVLSWISEMKDHDIELCILSNSLGKRVQHISRQFKLPFVSKAVKRRKKSFLQAIKVLGLSHNQVGVIGDQLLTDIWGGNRLGLYTILIVPRSTSDFITTRVVRFLERFILKRLEKKRMLSSITGDL